MFSFHWHLVFFGENCCAEENLDLKCVNKLNDAAADIGKVKDNFSLKSNIDFIIKKFLFLFSNK